MLNHRDVANAENAWSGFLPTSSRIHAVVGNFSCIALDRWFPTAIYLPHPWGRTSCMNAMDGVNAEIARLHRGKEVGQRKERLSRSKSLPM
ncbi:MAG: hypothetical protein ACR65R_06060 [Methylomicrobium sp.]